MLVGAILLGLLVVLIVGGNLAFVIWYYFGGRGEATDRSPKPPEGMFRYLDAGELTEELDRVCEEGRDEDVVGTPV